MNLTLEYVVIIFLYNNRQVKHTAGSSTSGGGSSRRWKYKLKDVLEWKRSYALVVVVDVVLVDVVVLVSIQTSMKSTEKNKSE
jgi:hypothetical protein